MGIKPSTFSSQENSRELRLNCENCGEFREYFRTRRDPQPVVRCGRCGKKHSNDSVWMIDTEDVYPRDSDGELLEDPI